MTLRLVPVTLADAKAFIGLEHRHHAPPVGHRFSIGVENGQLRGVVVVGRPVARGNNGKRLAEVTRLATDGTKNACSMLYAAAARAAKAMGYDRIETYILDSELGASLRASGWRFDGMTDGGDWNHGRRAQPTLFGDMGRRTDQPQGRKQRWVKDLVGSVPRTGHET